MTESRPGHPLDVDLADLVDGLVDDDRAASLEAHLASCQLCRVKRVRLAEAGPAPPLAGDLGPGPEFPMRFGGEHPSAGEPVAGELWLTTTDERLLVLVTRADRTRLLVVPVTFDIEAADDETVVLEADRSPLATDIAIYSRLATDVPRAALRERVAHVSADEVAGVLDGTALGVRRGAPIAGVGDARLDVREELAERLRALGSRPPDPLAGDAAAALRSSVIADIRSLRGDTSTVTALHEWGDVVLAGRAGWAPLATIDEVGIVLVVLDTPHGLADDGDFHVARSVLTRLNATALVVLASGLSDLADVFDSPALNHGIAVPSGEEAAPRPLIAGLSPFDAVTKYLDQTTGVRAAAPPMRGGLAGVDVREILRQAAGSAITDVARQGSRFKIAPKRRGYESVVDAHDLLIRALEEAFDGRSVVERLLGSETEPDA